MAIKPKIEEGKTVVPNNQTEIQPTTNHNELIGLDVDAAIEDWNAYQELCKKLLTESDYQPITVKQKDEKGNWISVKKQFPKKSAFFKLGRAFNVNTKIITREEYRHPKTHRVIDVYFEVRATLPNGRTVVANASCDKYEKGKDNSSAHDLRATAETRATNRAISKLIGAGEVSWEEINKK